MSIQRDIGINTVKTDDQIEITFYTSLQNSFLKKQINVT